MIITAIIDMLGVASILPFVAVLSNPTIVDTNSFLNYLFQFSIILGVENKQQFLFFLGILIFIFLISALIIKSFTSYLQFRFIQMQEYIISKKLIEGYISQPYEWFLDHHSTDLGKNILSEVQQVVVHGLNPFMELFANLMIIISIISLLILSNIQLAFLVGFTLSGIYVIIFYSIRKYVKGIGSKRLKNNQLRFTSINETFGAIKEIKLGGIESIYLKKFSSAAKIYAKTQSNVQILSLLPRFFLEAVSFGGILLIILFYMKQTSSSSLVIPVISLYVFAGYRLMPALQKVYSSFTQLTFVGPSLDKLYGDLKNLNKLSYRNKNDNISLDRKISLKNITYHYPNSSKNAIEDININFLVNSKVGIIGKTGSGKTTLIDVFLGLLQVNQGCITVDGVDISYNNLKSWQKLIGYVPQNIFLVDDTISSNIAFGVNKKKINKKLIEEVAKIANLHDFITKELPERYNTKIGENGVRLSGGQRQRIGIARALYHKPKLLVLDEATSALDIQTESEVMKAIEKLNKNMTVIVVTHRINTLKNFDIVFKLHNGEIIYKGSPQKILNLKKI